MLADDARLSAALRAQLIPAMPHRYISAASIWELSITQARGQLPLLEDLVGAVPATGLPPRPITLAHARAAGWLPRPHRDPFARMPFGQLIRTSYSVGRYAPTDLGSLPCMPPCH